MYLSDVMIEVTRRCNMCCTHCLRGPAQSRDIELKHIVAFATRIEGCRIGCLTLSGGEPSLVSRHISGIVDILKEHNIEVQNFYIATNGKHITDGFVSVCFKLWDFCTDNDFSGVHLSNDMYHDEDQTSFDKLKCFTFANSKYTKENRNYIPMNEGNAMGMGDRSPSETTFCVEDDYITEGELYINVFGQIINGCNWSYENQTKHALGNVNDDFISIIKYKYAV